MMTKLAKKILENHTIHTL